MYAANAAIPIMPLNFGVPSLPPTTSAVLRFIHNNNINNNPFTLGVYELGQWNFGSAGPS